LATRRPEVATKRKRPTKREPKPLREGSWAGHTNYECTRCGFKSLDRDTALEHILNKHAIKEEAAE
jgi:hypothetical protein